MNLTQAQLAVKLADGAALGARITRDALVRRERERGRTIYAIAQELGVSQNAVRLNLEPTNNIYLPGGRRVRGFMGIEALVHPAA